ncbi:MAG: hypothetical protein JNM30_09145 [Rhodospirillales bacterium]|nr:hypothetical protein [Rhodospirillales bacterium]
MHMDHIQDRGAGTAKSAFAAFWFHIAAAIGCLPAMVGLSRRIGAERSADSKPRQANPAHVARPGPRRGNLVEAAMLAIAASEAREARKSAAARSGHQNDPPHSS